MISSAAPGGGGSPGGRCRPGEWVQIESILLKPGERAPQVPEDTQAVPLVMRAKGFATAGAEIGDEMEVRTIIGRLLRGRLIAVNPPYEHDYGRPLPELMPVAMELRAFMKANGSDAAAAEPTGGGGSP